MNHIAKDIIYSMAILLGLCLFFYAFPAEAQVSKGQVRNIVNRVIDARLPSMIGPQGAPGLQGPQGPQGDPGKGALPFIFARVGPDADVDESRSFGITDADVTYFYGPGGQVHYCIIIPATGAQVTVDGSTAPQGAAPHTRLLEEVQDGCNTFVSIFHEGNAISAGFFITIY